MLSIVGVSHLQNNSNAIPIYYCGDVPKCILPYSSAKCHECLNQAAENHPIFAGGWHEWSNDGDVCSIRKNMPSLYWNYY